MRRPPPPRIRFLPKRTVSNAHEQFIALGLDTTGWDTETDRIVELAIVIFEHGFVSFEWESRVNPIPFSEAQWHAINGRALNGVMREDLRMAPVFSSIADELGSFFAAFPALCVHDAPFTLNFLNTAFVLSGRQTPRFTVVYDTKAIARQLFRGYLSALDILCGELNVRSARFTPGRIDTALRKAEAAGRLLLKMKERVPGVMQMAESA